MDEHKRVLVIDDHPVFIAALETILKRIRRDMPIDSATSAEAALQQIEYYSDYQFILLDLNMPGLDGFALLRILEQRKLPIPVIIVSSNEDSETVHACIGAGAVGYIPKSYDMQQMVKAIEQIQNGEIYLPEAILPLGSETEYRAVTETDGVLKQQRCEQMGISNKSHQVLICLARGKTNKEIADELNISVHTVKAHLAKLYDRLETKNRMDTVMEAIRLCLVDR